MSEAGPIGLHFLVGIEEFLVPSLMRRRGADCLVVVRHRRCRPTANETLVSHCRVVGIELRRRVCFNARGAKGAGHRRWERANWQQEELQFSTEGGSLRAVARAG